MQSKTSLFSKFVLSLTVAVFAQVSLASEQVNWGFKVSNSKTDKGCLWISTGPRALEPTIYGFRYAKLHSTGSLRIQPSNVRTDAADYCDSDNVTQKYYPHYKSFVSENFRVIVDSRERNFGKFPQELFVLISKEVCAQDPTLVFVSHDEYQGYTNGGFHTGYLSREFYESDATALSSIKDFEVMYSNLFLDSNLGNFDDYDMVFPHQFYTRSERGIENPQDGNAVERGLLYATNAIYHQCQTLPDVLKIQGVMGVGGKHNHAYWKPYFSGKIDLTSKKSGIVPDPEYREITDLLGRYYEKAAEARQKPYTKPDTGLEIDDQTLFALGAAFFFSAIAVERMIGNEQCDEEPSSCW